MPIENASRPWHRLLLTTGVLVSCGLLAVGGAWAQGLDMDSGSGTPAPPAHQSGGLDMDVNPDAPIPPKAAVQALPRDNVQDGIAPLNTTKTTQDTPLAPGIATPGIATPGIATPGIAAPSDTPTPAPTPATVVEQATPAAPVTLDHPKVIDTAKLQSGDTTVSLYGIEGVAGPSAQGLQSFIGSGDGRLTCQAQASMGFVCLTADGTNVAQVALVNGAAKTTPDAPDSYRQQEAAAQDARRGIWANLPPPPEVLKHPVVQDTSTLFANGKTYVLDSVVGFDVPYSTQLQGYIATNGDSVTCSPQNDLGNYICLLPDGTDVAKVALVNGAARVAQDAPDTYRVQQLDALNNRRGYWATAPEAVLTAALLPPPPDPDYILVAGDDGMDGVYYVGGAPMAVIDGDPEFLVYGDDDLGWGYYDHFHHWHGAPDRFRRHMDHFHPGGHGLRGGHDAFHHDAATRGRAEAMHRDAAGMRGREEAGMRGREAAGMRGREEAGLRGREEAARGGARPGMGGREDAMRAGGARPGMGGARPGLGGARPGAMAMGGERPGMGGARPGMGGARPGMGGARPGAMAMGGARPMGGGAPAMHSAPAAPRGGGGGGGKHK